MPTIYKGSRHTKCPYYIREAELSITCESVYNQVNSVLKFDTKGKKEKFQKEHCYKYPNQCVTCRNMDSLNNSRRK